MKKIPSIFRREVAHDSHHQGANPVIDEQTPGTEWVFAGEGVATRKYDGTAVLVRDGKVFVRYDAKHGKQAPQGWEPCQEAPDADGHWPGWLPFDRKDRRLVEATQRQLQEAGPPSTTEMQAPGLTLPDGTYELCGPKVNGNPEGFTTHILVKHDTADTYPDCPRTFEGLRSYLAEKNIEGIVWHHPDGRMAKIKKGDFGLKRHE